MAGYSFSILVRHPSVGSKRLTMCPRNFSPYHSYLAPPNLPLPAVDVCDPLPQVEAGVFGVVDAFDLDEGGVGVGVAFAALVGDVSASVGHLRLV